MMLYKFKAKIYKTGINACVDVPKKITDMMKPTRGYIFVRGKINGFEFKTNLVPVKNKLYRLFVNIPMLNAGKTELHKIAEFEIIQDFNTKNRNYPMPEKLSHKLAAKNLTDEFNKLTDSRQRNILKYLHNIKTEETLEKNILKLILKLENKEKDIRIP